MRQFRHFGRSQKNKFGQSQNLVWPNLVLAKVGLAKLGLGQTWFGQTWSWPNLVWPNLVIASLRTDAPTHDTQNRFCSGVEFVFKWRLPSYECPSP